MFKKAKYTKSPADDKMLAVWKDTLQYLEKNYSYFKPSEKIDTVGMKVNTPKDKYELNIEVVDSDTLEMAIEYVNSGLNPLVINMASDFVPGGGVRSGRVAQEEELFKRTTAVWTHTPTYYPLKVNEVVYSPEVKVIRETAKNGYKFIKEKDQVKISMIACAALRKPKLVHSRYTYNDYQIMEAKIDSIFKVALDKGHDSLVLGALGCGAFGNPPEEVAMIFSKMIGKYGDYFKKIGFAILVVKSTDQANLDVFTKEMEKYMSD